MNTDRPERVMEDGRRRCEDSVSKAHPERLLHPFLKSRAGRYAIAVIAIATAFVLRQTVFGPVFGSGFTYILFFPAVMAVATFAGLGPGLLATALAAIVSVVWIFPPGPMTAPNAISLGVFSAMGVFMNVVAERYRRTRVSEESLRESEALKAAILNSSLDAIVSMDASGLIVEFNQAAEKMFGHRAADAIGRPLAGVIIPERLRAAHNRGLAHYLASGEGPVLNKRIEMPALRADGSEFPVELSINRIPGIEPPRFSGFIRDITERKQAEEALRQQREWFEVTLSSIGDAVITTDTQGQVTFLNPVATQMTGWNSREAVGLPLEKVFNIIHEDTREPVENPITQVLREGIMVGLANHTALIAKDGTETSIEDSAAPIRDAAGKVSGAVMVFHDVSERRRAEKALRQRHAQFETLVNVAPLGIYMVDADFRLRLVNPIAVPVFGNIPDLVGRDFDEVIHILWPKAQADAVVERFRHTLKTGEPYIAPDWIEERFDREATEFYEWQINRIPLPDGRYGVVCYFRDISERVLAQQKIRESEERYRTLFASAPMAVFVCDLNAVIQYYNPRAVELWGREPECGVEKHCGSVKLWLPDGTLLPHTQSPMVDVLRTGDPALNVEVFIERPDGSRVPVLVNFGALKDAQGKITGAITSFIDITERKRAEEALREAARLAALRVDISSALVSGETLPEVLQLCTEALVKHLDVAFARIWTLNDTENVLELQASAGLYTHLDGPHGRVKVGEFKIGRIGQSGHPLLTNDVLHDPNISDLDWARREGMVAFAGYPMLLEGSGLGVVAMFARHAFSETVLNELAPIADGIAQWVKRKQAENALRGSEKKFRAMADAIPQLAWTADATGFIHWYNRRWYEYTGTTLQDMEGWGWQSVHDPKTLPKVLERWQASIATGNTFEMIFPLRGADGQFRPFLTRVNALKDDQGRVVHWFGTNTDVEDQKRAEEKLERTVAQRTAQLTEKIGELEAFSYSIVHDLRAPLRSMQGYSMVLVDECGPKLDPEAKMYLDRISNSAERMDRLIQDVLSFSRVARSELKLEPVRTDKLLRDIVETYPDLRAQRGQILIEGKLPIVEGNEAALTQCFSNLLGNAVKFVAPGTQPFIRVWAEQSNGRARIFFADNGIGIPEHTHERIFGLFQRATSDYEGTGVGLPIVKKSVERMGGTVGLKSELGKGSTFWLELKLASPEKAGDE